MGKTLEKGYKLKEFIIQSVLGQGGFGITYLAIDTNLKKEFVIKEFFPKELVARNPDSSISLQKIEDEYNENKRKLYKRRYNHFLKKFESEAQIMASIDHPNIVKVIRYFENNNTGYFVMNYIKGESLKEYVKRVGKLTQEQIMEIIIPIMEGLKTVHNANFLHRDIAPDNILLTQKGKPMLIDFGAAKNTIIDNDGTEISIGIVKKGYSAPEQYSDDTLHTVSTDIYSIGAVIAFMIMGKMPPEATTRLTLVSTSRDPLEVELEKYYGDFTQGFIKAVLRAMSLNEKNRFKDILSFQKALITTRISLKNYLEKKSKKLNEKEIIELINPLLDIVESLHSKNQIHGNLSPENIFLKKEKIVELGRSMDIIANSSKSLTAIRNIGYSAPEQYSMDSKDIKQTDIYSIGAIMLYIITRKIPTEAIKRQTEIYNGKEDSIKKILNKYRNLYSDNFLKVILKAMKLNPHDRFSDIMLFRETLKKPIPPPSSYKKIIFIFLGLLLFGFVTYFILNKGDILKQPPSKQKKEDVNITQENDLESFLETIK